MKVDLMTAGAVAFAGFAAWYALRKSGTLPSLTGAQQTAYGMSTAQRQQSGAAIGQNTSYLGDTWGNLSTATINQIWGIK